MATATPHAAELPLPGGSEGATVKLHPLLCGQARGPDAWFHRQPGPLAPLRAIGVGSESVDVPIVCFCVEHPGAGPILIDTGLHPSVVENARANFGPLNS